MQLSEAGGSRGVRHGSQGLGGSRTTYKGGRDRLGEYRTEASVFDWSLGFQDDAHGTNKGPGDRPASICLGL